MSSSIFTRRVLAALAVCAVLVAAPTAGAAEQEPFVPFVTDFGKEPRPAGEPVVIRADRPGTAAAGGRLDWSDVGIGVGLGLALGGLAATPFALRGLRRGTTTAAEATK